MNRFVVFIALFVAAGFTASATDQEPGVADDQLLLPGFTGIPDLYVPLLERRMMFVGVPEKTIVMGEPLLNARTIWTPYIGSNQVSEERFYLHAGRREEAKEARSYQETTESLQLWGSNGMLFSGSFLILTALIQNDPSADPAAANPDALAAIYGVLGGIFVGSLITFVVALARGKTGSSAVDALAVAEEFNEDLYRALSSSDNPDRE